MQNIAISPLQVEKYYLKELNFQLNQGVELEKEKLESLDVPEITISAAPKATDKDKRQWKCELKIETKKNKNTPYSFRIVLVGFFSISENYPKGKVELLAKTNSPSILYSTAREMLTTTIRRSPFPPILLPSLMFLEIPPAADMEKKTTKSVKSKK